MNIAEKYFLLCQQLQSQIDELSKDDPFYSILTKSTISNANFEICKNAWQEGWTFADYVKFYNDVDVIGFTEALVKYLNFNKTLKLYPLKMSMSLPGLTKRYAFQNLPKEDYFSGFGEEHKWLVNDLQNSIIGGPSIVFHRWHERMQTTIKISIITIAVVSWDLMQILYTYTVSVKKCRSNCTN